MNRYALLVFAALVVSALVYLGVRVEKLSQSFESLETKLDSREGVLLLPLGGMREDEK